MFPHRKSANIPAGAIFVLTAPSHRSRTELGTEANLTVPRISFSFEPCKFIQAAAYLTRRCPAMTRMKLVKLIYFADKRHLLQWGRPITGDRYIAMQHGPVPSSGYDMLKKPDGQFTRFFRVAGQSITMTADPGAGDLSPSGLEVLESVAREFGPLSATALRNRSHKDTAWQSAPDNGSMDFKDFFDTPESASILDLVRHEQEMRDFMKRFNHQAAIRNSLPASPMPPPAPSPRHATPAVISLTYDPVMLR